MRAKCDRYNIVFAVLLFLPIRREKRARKLNTWSDGRTEPWELL
jgi:hypothetical protein